MPADSTPRRRGIRRAGTPAAAPLRRPSLDDDPRLKRAGDFLVPASETQVADELARGGWQLDHLDRALAHVTKWSAAVDGGAHVGSWTRAMAARFGIVHAFEPAPDTYRCLVGNIGGLPGVSCHERALGRAAGRTSLLVDARYGEANTGGRFLAAADGIAGQRIADVDVVDLDSLDLSALGFLKLDVEGWEEPALRGARVTLERCRPVVLIEDKARVTQQAGLEPGRAAWFLSKLGAAEVDRVGSDRIFAWPR